MFFSDERQNATYSQFIGEIISTDGGLTWSANANGSTNFGPGEIKVVASPYQADRPGMATVAQMGIGGGDYVMSYEMCGPQQLRRATPRPPPTATTGDRARRTWAPRPETSDGLYLQESPVITWVANGGAHGTLYLTAHNEVTATGPIPEGQTVILANANADSGPAGPGPGYPPRPSPPSEPAPRAAHRTTART